MHKRWIKSFSVAVYGLAAEFILNLLNTSVAYAQTKLQIEAQIKKIETELRTMALSTHFESEITP